MTGGTVAANVAQGATFDPEGANTFFRFMPALAVDRAGDMAVGYSKSNAATNPQIKYAGRLAADPANTLGQIEQTLIDGTGAQSGDCGGSACTRWGDYSGMALDPNGCEFWMSNEYYATTGLNWFTGEYYPAGSTQFDWRTRIVSFRFPSCRKGQVLAPPSCTVPKVLGLALAKARTRIAGAHCTVGRVARKHAARKQRGKVVGQSPQAGKKLQAGAKVNLTLGT